MRWFLIIVAALAAIGFTAQPIFGMDGFSLFGELFIIAVTLSVFILVTVVLAGWVTEFFTDKKRTIATVMIVAFISCSVIGIVEASASLAASAKVADLKRKFVHVSEHGERTEYAKSEPVPEGGPHGAYNYYGGLDKVIALRDARLAKMGFVHCTGWSVLDSGTFVYALYFWWPFGHYSVTPHHSSSVGVLFYLMA